MVSRRALHGAIVVIGLGLALCAIGCGSDPSPSSRADTGAADTTGTGADAGSDTVAVGDAPAANDTALVDTAGSGDTPGAEDMAGPEDSTGFQDTSGPADAGPADVEQEGCPTAVIEVAEGARVIPQTRIHLSGSGVTAGAGPIVSYAWSVEQPGGSVSAFAPSSTVPNPTFDTNVAGTYTFRLDVTDEAGLTSCSPAEYTDTVEVVPDSELHIELLWYTEADPDPTDPFGSDMDLHFKHPDAAGPNDDGWFDVPWDVFGSNPAPTAWGDADPAVRDDPRLDRVADATGPENLNWASPTDGLTYTIGVYCASDHDYGPSDATVRVYIDGALAAELTRNGLVSLDLWEVATLDWPSGTITPQEAVTHDYSLPDSGE